MKFENLYIECESLEQRDEVFNVCLENGLELYCGANKYQSVRVTGGVFFTIDWKPDAKATKIDYSQFIAKYGKSEMKQSIEKAMAELKMGREELSSALGMSRPYITKMLTRPQSEKTQAKVIGMIDDLYLKPKSIGKLTVDLSIDPKFKEEIEKVVNENNQLKKELDHKNQVLDKRNDLFKDMECEVNSLNNTISSMREVLNGLKLKNSTLESKNKDINTCYAIVCVILTALVVWGFYV